MTDIVERLRHDAWTGVRAEVAETMRKAADDIERLRKETDEYMLAMVLHAARQAHLCDEDD